MSDPSLMVFDIIGTYFVKTYWTVLYDAAASNKKYRSQEDAYIATVDMYTAAVSKRENPTEKSNKNYITLVKDLFRETQKYAPTVQTMSDFINFVMQQFIPQEYYAAMGHQSTYKENMFRNILKESLTQFSLYVVSDELQTVINQQTRKEWEQHLPRWQKKFIQILQTEKSKLIRLLLAEKHGVKGGDDGETVPKVIADNMTRKIKELMEELHQRDEEKAKYLKYIDFLKTTISTRDRTMQNLLTQLQALGIINQQGQVIYKQKRSGIGAQQPQPTSNPDKQSLPPSNVQSQKTQQPMQIMQSTSPKQSQPHPMKDVVEDIVKAEYSDDDYNDVQDNDTPANAEDITPDLESDPQDEQTQPTQQNESDLSDDSYEELKPDDK